MQIRSTNLFSNYNQMIEDVYSIINTVGWGTYNQIGLNYRPNATNTWTDAVGGLFDRTTKQRIGYEKDFTVYNKIPSYLLKQFNLLKQQENCNFGRIRLMRLTPRSGLSVHQDYETRYHFVVDTNPKSFFCFNTGDTTNLNVQAHCYHIPKDGQWYHIDTKQTHWVYNGGDTDRIHLVICAI